MYFFLKRVLSILHDVVCRLRTMPQYELYQLYGNAKHDVMYSIYKTLECERKKKYMCDEKEKIFYENITEYTIKLVF